MKLSFRRAVVNADEAVETPVEFWKGPVSLVSSHRHTLRTNFGTTKLKPSRNMLFFLVMRKQLWLLSEGILLSGFFRFRPSWEKKSKWLSREPPLSHQTKDTLPPFLCVATLHNAARWQLPVLWTSRSETTVFASTSSDAWQCVATFVGHLPRSRSLMRAWFRARFFPCFEQKSLSRRVFLRLIRRAIIRDMTQMFPCCNPVQQSWLVCSKFKIFAQPGSCSVRWRKKQPRN